MTESNAISSRPSSTPSDSIVPIYREENKVHASAMRRISPDRKENGLNNTQRPKRQCNIKKPKYLTVPAPPIDVSKRPPRKSNHSNPTTLQSQPFQSKAFEKYLEYVDMYEDVFVKKTGRFTVHELENFRDDLKEKFPNFSFNYDLAGHIPKPGLLELQNRYQTFYKLFSQQDPSVTVQCLIKLQDEIREAGIREHAPTAPFNFDPQGYIAAAQNKQIVLPATPTEIPAAMPTPSIERNFPAMRIKPPGPENSAARPAPSVTASPEQQLRALGIPLGRPQFDNSIPDPVLRLKTFFLQYHSAYGLTFENRAQPVEDGQFTSKCSISFKGIFLGSATVSDERYQDAEKRAREMAAIKAIMTIENWLYAAIQASSVTASPEQLLRSLGIPFWPQFYNAIVDPVLKLKTFFLQYQDNYSLTFEERAQPVENGQFTSKCSISSNGILLGSATVSDERYQDAEKKAREMAAIKAIMTIQGWGTQVRNQP